MMEYQPRFLASLNGADVPTAWKGLEQVIPDILLLTGIDTCLALEFGVEYGYSMSIWAQLFARATGVDQFAGEKHPGSCGPCFIDKTRAALTAYPNIELVQADVIEWMKACEPRMRWDLVHIDSVPHEPTLSWAVRHADLVLVHDTELETVREIAERVVSDQKGWSFWNYPRCHGLGILTDRLDSRPGLQHHAQASP